MSDIMKYTSAVLDGILEDDPRCEWVRLEDHETKIKKLGLREMQLIGESLEDAKRIKELEAQLAWQPIETAPKDETVILTLCKNGRIAPAVWYDNPFGDIHTVIDNFSGKWWTVTHWMPLPKPPKEQPHE